MPSVVGQITKGATFDKLIDAVHVAGTAHRLLYTGADGVVNELAYGTSGQHLKSEGASSAPTWETPSAGGVDTSGTPVANDFARFTDADTIEGLSYAEVKTALDLEIGTDIPALSHAAQHMLGGADILQVSATDRFLGRDTVGAGDVEEITAVAARTILNVADGANAYVHPNHSGDVTSVADGAQTIVADAVTYDKMQDTTGTDILLGRATAGVGTVEEITCTAAGRALIDDANAAAQRTTLGLLIGTDIPALVHAAQHTDGTDDIRDATDALKGIAKFNALDFAVIAGQVNAGIQDSDQSHYILLRTTSNLSANRILNIVPGDAARTITVNGNVLLNDWFNQNVKSGQSPTFDGANFTGITTAGVEDELKSHDKIEYIKSPTDSDDYPIFYTKKAITITEVRGVTDAGTLTFQLKWRPWATMFTAGGTNILSASLVASTTGVTTTSFADATIPAGSVIAYVASAESANPVELAIPITFTVD